MSSRIVILNAGHIEQIGTPEEIYEHPRTLFAADFIGQNNLLLGTVTSVTPEGLTLEVNGVSLPALPNDFFSPAVGERAALCLRPQRIRYGREPQHRMALKGIIRSKEYVGGMQHTQIALNDALLLNAVTQSAELDSFPVGEIMGVTGEVTLSNYARLASPDYVKVLLQSLKLAALTTAICIVVGYPFGYLMARLSPVARSVVMLLIIVPFWTNALIRIYGWRILLMGNGPINTLLMNLGLIQEPLKLLYTDGAVLLGMVYALIPFMILPTFTTVDKLDFSVVEAARDLGASPLHAFFTVTVPLTLPGLMAGCVLVFIPSMGLFFLNDLLGGSKSVLAGGLIQQLINSRDLPMAAALSVLLLAVTGAVIAVYRKVGGTGDMSMF